MVFQYQSRRWRVGSSALLCLMGLTVASCETAELTDGLNAAGSAVAATTGMDQSTAGGMLAGGLLSNAGNVANALNWSDTNQKAIADRGLQQMRAKGKILDDAPLTVHLTSIAQSMASYSGIQRFQYEVHVIDDPSFNAFTFGAGRLFIHKGAIVNLTTEAQMAALIGHEMAHGLQNHARRGRSVNTAMQIGMAAAGRVAPEIFSGGGGTASAFLSRAALAQFSQQQEFEADVIGADLMIRAGYDPRGAVELHQALQAIAGRRSALVNAFTSSHPTSDQRIARMRHHLQTGRGQTDLGQMTVNTDRYRQLTARYR